jgi:c-di-GMP-binding flagellar brake protein YcgR
MPSVATNAVKIEPAITGQDNPFMVGSRLEITHILHAIMREAALITVTLNASDFFLTSIMAIDESTDSMFLERGRSGPRLSSALKTRRLPCSTTLDKIKIRFTCEGIEATDYAGNDAYRIALPAEMLRIQRREYYRMPAPLIAPVKCRISNDENTADAGVELNLCDISCGGIAVQSPPALFTPDLGDCYLCTILLPGTPGLHVTIQARNAFMIALPNGKITQRSGFAFVNPPENISASVQRYILNLERQRRTR